MKKFIIFFIVLFSIQTFSQESNKSLNDESIDSIDETKEIKSEIKKNESEDSKSEGKKSKGQKQKKENRKTELVNVSSQVGLPHPITFSVGYRFIPQVAVFYETGSYSTTVDGVGIGIKNQEFGVMYYPFSGAFYLKAAMGKHIIQGSKTENISYDFFGVPSNDPITANVEVSANYQHLGLGWRWHPLNFLSLGCEFGVLNPSGASTSVSATGEGLGAGALAIAELTPEYQAMKNDVVKTGNDYGSTSLPKVALITLGFSY